MAKSVAKNSRKKQQATKISSSATLVGRESESALIRACLSAGKNMLLEGPVGVGKTHLALAIAQSLGRPVYRVDGDSRYTEQKLSGWFDPPLVLKHGFGARSFIPGPLVEAMQKGGVLFVNEMNRLPEGVQNVLLPSIDERLLAVPRLGTIHAHKNFLVIATQNPKEFVATSHLSEAILDRFEWVYLDYQSEVEETAIVSERVSNEQIARLAVRVARLTRGHPRVKRGASVRAAMSIAEVTAALLRAGGGLREAFLSAVRVALPTRIELERDTEGDDDNTAALQALLQEWVESAFKNAPAESLQKKKS